MFKSLKTIQFKKRLPSLRICRPISLLSAINQGTRSWIPSILHWIQLRRHLYNSCCPLSLSNNQLKQNNYENKEPTSKRSNGRPKNYNGSLESFQLQYQRHRLIWGPDPRGKRDNLKTSIPTSHRVTTQNKQNQNQRISKTKRSSFHVYTNQPQTKKTRKRKPI